LFPSASFTVPDGVIKATVSSVSGKLPTSLTKQRGRLVTDWFNIAYLPKETDDALVKMAFITYNGVNYIAQDSTPSDFIYEEIVIKRKKPLDELMQEIADAQSKLPAKSRRAMSAYLPPDASSDAPSQVDPRVDDGSAPAPPANIRANANGSGKVEVTFNGSPEKDVVGYRLYRSIDQGSYQKVENSLPVGQSNSFTSSVSFSNSYRFYVTAVDVGGRESAPSIIATTSGNIIPPLDPGSSSPNPTTPVDGGNGIGTNKPPVDGAAEPEPSNGVPGTPGGVKVSTTDIGILLTWNANPVSNQVLQYDVYYSETGSGRYNKIGSTADARFEYVSPLQSGWFRVTAVNERGESEMSGAVQLK